MCIAAPGRVIRLYQREGLEMGEVDFGGIAREVCLAHVPGVRAGDHVMVHAGFALEIIDESEVARFQQLWREVLTGGRAGEESP
ncbi:MAG TPA: HypC/HybG/HupF family hydrogenase formation chaperone [bacterium]|nr:HypC/HybG/HupF family hydrogenase formation chaperone [bacterium]HOH07349.1 HypC/HybG/HupF family hydrogenase formation chaperone [bacterium]